jgi:hypothetical protein
MRSSTIVVAVAATVGLSLPSYAATLQSVAGTVSINHGAGYKAAGPGSEAKVGDVVMASPGARAQLVYPDGCKVPVNPGAVVTIQAESPCAGAYAQVPGDNTGAYVAGALLLGGVGAGIYYITQNNKKSSTPTYFAASSSKPASP